jgi:hypothetical protein
LTEDSWQGDENQPMSYNLWLYGNANPIQYLDPSGFELCRNGLRYCMLTDELNGKKVGNELQGVIINIDHWDAGKDMASEQEQS